MVLKRVTLQLRDPHRVQNRIIGECQLQAILYFSVFFFFILFSFV